tara:strand:- start:4632 stop:5840 length:1209 start_codon:yes stop_codon:yes gene_type:complete
MAVSQQSTGNPSSITFAGANNGAATTTAARRALYLKLFSGELFKGFQRNTIARDLITKRTLKNGRSMQFIFTGRTKSEYHIPGNNILGNTDGAPPVAEVTIECDDLLISSAFVYELDETLAHYDLRGEISRKIGYALAENYDRRIFRAITKSARSAGPITKSTFVEPGGTQIRVGTTGTNKADAYNPTMLVNAFYDAAAALDEKGVSGEGRVAVLNPRQYYELIQAVGGSGSGAYLINRDEQGDALQSGNGIIEIAGIRIYKSMNIPFFSNFGTKYGTSSNDTGVAEPTNTGSFVDEAMGNQQEIAVPTANASANEGQRTVNDYGEEVKFSNSCGLIFQKEAVGLVEAIGPQVQVTSGDVSVIYQGDVILGRLAMGVAPLNPAAAVELVAGAAVNSGNTAAF